MKSHASNSCSFCGREHYTDFSGGEWHGPHETVYCCAGCATKVLPVLIADSIHISGSHFTTAGYTLLRVESTFWKGIASRISGAVGDLASKLAALAEKQARAERGVK